MVSTSSRPRAESFFRAVTARPVWTILVTLVPVFACAAFLPRLTRDMSPEAFIPSDHPAVLYRDRVEEIFGLEDPMVLAIVDEGSDGIFTPENLALVHWLTEEVSRIPGVDPDRITSLATEKNISGTEMGFLVEEFLEDPPESTTDARRIRDAVMGFELYVGSLVAHDGSATLIVAELLDPEWEEPVYEDLLELVERAPRSRARIHVAGPAAVNASLGNYVDADQRRLNPVAFGVIIAILILCYRTLRGVAVPLLVVVGALATAVGAMAAAGFPFYIITNSLSVVLIAISVADAIHILGEYYEQQARDPDAPARDVVVRSMTKMWRPVTFTSITTIFGFLGLGLASYMPPMRAYGYFASVGVAAALLLSVLVVPAVLVLLSPQTSGAFPSAAGGRRVDTIGRLISRFGGAAIRRPGATLAIGAAIVVLGALGAARLRVDGAFIEVFEVGEDIFQADAAINEKLDGTNYVDVVVETREPEGLFDPERLRKIEELQEFAEQIPHVKGSTSLVDYLKQMNRALNEDREEAYRLPEEPDLIAQYFILYAASGDPTDFEEIVDYDYRRANVRITMDTGLYSHERRVIEELTHYLREHFDSPGIEATISGRATVHYHWIDELARSHFRGVFLALVGVWMAASLSFRSPVAGLLAIVPVAMAVLLTYAVMGFGDIALNGPMSMIAAIAIGTGVDFALHVLDRLVLLVRDDGRDLDEALEHFLPSTGRAVFFSFVAVALGFGVLATSRIPTLVNFGVLVGVAVTVSFVFSVTFLPVLVRLLRPRFLLGARGPETASEDASARA